MSYFTSVGDANFRLDGSGRCVDAMNQPADPKLCAPPSFFQKIVDVIAKPAEAITGKTSAELAKSATPLPGPTKTASGTVVFTDPITGKKFKTAAERDAFTRGGTLAAASAARAAGTRQAILIGGIGVAVVGGIWLLTRKKKTP